ncbi:YbdD/YjiX family protein [Actinobaculum massiliense]|nr:YbdD/YjiX family protein [Actinobaculum massiliense]MDK8319936.1 YbdD/YjiX family protein [Actinobaculum massiliense]MDK8566610.1 YbdD/YjiX family protein [Actinobaculum massiliense]
MAVTVGEWSRKILKSCVAALRRAQKMWRDFMGDSAYERYLDHHRRNHPNCQPMTEKEFWRSRDDFKEDNVSTGCC